MFSHTLVPLDGSLTAEQALACAHHVTHGKLLLLRVQNYPSVLASPLEQAELLEVLKVDDEAAHHYLDGVTRRLKKEGLEVSWIHRIGDPASVILEVAQTENIDLIVMASHGRTGLSRVLLGSVAEKVVRHAHCPVLIVRRPATAKIEESHPTEVKP